MIKEMGQIRVVSSDGLGRNTRVYDSAGNLIDRIRRVELTLDAKDINRATLEILMPKIDITAKAIGKEICPYCGTEKKEEEDTDLEDITSAEAEKIEEDLHRLDMRLGKIKVSEI